MYCWCGLRSTGLSDFGNSGDGCAFSSWFGGSSCSNYSSRGFLCGAHAGVFWIGSGGWLFGCSNGSTSSGDSSSGGSSSNTCRSVIICTFIFVIHSWGLLASSHEFFFLISYDSAGLEHWILLNSLFALQVAVQGKFWHHDVFTVDNFLDGCDLARFHVIAGVPAALVKSYRSVQKYLTGHNVALTFSVPPGLNVTGTGTMDYHLPFKERTPR